MILERPKLIEVGGKVVGEVYFLDLTRKEMCVMFMAPTVYVGHPICNQCGRVYHATQGGSGFDSLCIGCYITNSYLDSGREGDGFEITTPFGTLEFTESEIKDFLENWGVVEIDG